MHENWPNANDSLQGRRRKVCSLTVVLVASYGIKE